MALEGIARAAGALASTRLAAACLLAIGLLAGCASSNNDALKALNPDPPDKMYAFADGLLNNGSYADAAKKFEDLDRDHPYAPEARRAIVMAAYAYYKAGKYPEAIASAKRYTTLHPGTKDAALAHHIIASANFDEIKDPLRDQTATRRALEELKTLVQRYPDSPYSRQAWNRIRLAQDLLAASEMQVGRYYQNRNNYVAAINRYKVVVTEYQTTPQVEEALYRIVESNMALGIVTEAQTATAVLGHNFPNSEWYQHSYALLKSGGLSPQITQGTWLSNAIKAITPGSQKKPEVKPQAPSPGMPSPEDLPAPRVPSDVPVSSAPSKPPLGLAEWQPEVRR
ncbi:MAG TPA: outer membrane protein assembly factor BamD [Hyphomicrobiaceae bacterium]|jgi:outer membrane protein assembly factor BamD|nr:outer membrane protein assembly factor BamD [Hyphomicrobiaceae bacterium]